MDKTLLLLLALLALTLILFVTDVFPYPFGFLVLIGFVIARLLAIGGGAGGKRDGD